MHATLTNLCQRLEDAQASHSRAMVLSQRGLVPDGGSCALRLKGAHLVRFSDGHPLNQGLALGFEGPMNEDDFAVLERFLGHPTVVESTPGADPSVHALLATRGYALRAFQQVWWRSLEHLMPLVPVAEVRAILPHEAHDFARVVTAGFCDRDDLTDEGTAMIFPATLAENTTCFLAWVGEEPAGAAMLFAHHGTAVLSSASVLPKFRGQGVQRALIQARLVCACELGCTEACSATLPGSPSQRNLQHCGFEVAYPKAEWVK